MNMQPFANAVMSGVVKSGVISDSNVAEAVDVMRAEIKAFFVGDKYADARDCVMRGSLPDATIISLIIANCADRLR